MLNLVLGKLFYVAPLNAGRGRGMIVCHTPGTGGGIIVCSIPGTDWWGE